MSLRNSTANSQQDSDDEEEDEEENASGVPLFLVNRSGFPMDVATLDKMWTHVNQIHPDGKDIERRLRNANSLPEVSIPVCPNIASSNASVREKLKLIQNYMNQLQYNHTGTQFFDIKKNRPISRLVEAAKEMVRESLPIKCLEAVILSLFLSHGMTVIDRFPISFKSRFNGFTFRHVVLGIHFNGEYGTLGMSRRSDLMDKPVIFDSLSSLVANFEKAYKNYWHQLDRVAIGAVIPHDLYSHEPIAWRCLVVHPNQMKKSDKALELNRYGKYIQHLQSYRQQVPAAKLASIKNYVPSTANKMMKVKRKSGKRSRRRKSSTASVAKDESTAKIDAVKAADDDVAAGSDDGTEVSDEETDQASGKAPNPLEYNIRI